MDGNVNKLARRVVITTGAVLLVLLGAVLYLESAWFRGWLESQASEQLGRDVEIGGHGIDWGLPLTLRLDDVRVANAPWAEAPMASLDELSVTLDVGALLGGEIVLERLAVVRPEVRLLRREDGTTNIDDLIDEPTEEQEIALWPETFSIDQGRLVYRDESQRIDLDVAFDTPGESIEHLSVDVRGEGRVQGEAALFQGLLHLELEERRGGLETFQGRLGDSRLRGALALDMGRDVPRLMVDLEADTLDLNRWSEALDADAGPPEREATEQRRPLAQRLEVLRSFEAEVDLAIGRLQIAERSFHDVAFEAALRDGRLAIERLQAMEPLGDGNERRLALQGRVQAQDDAQAALLERGRLYYRDTAQQVDLEAIFEAPDEPGEGQRLQVRGEGRLQEDPVDFAGLLYLDVEALRGGVEGLEANIAESRLEGSLAFDVGRETPVRGRAPPSPSLPTTWGANAFRPAAWSITPSGPPRWMAWWIEACRAT